MNEINISRQNIDALARNPIQITFGHSPLAYWCISSWWRAWLASIWPVRMVDCCFFHDLQGRIFIIFPNKASCIAQHTNSFQSSLQVSDTYGQWAAILKKMGEKYWCLGISRWSGSCGSGQRSSGQNEELESLVLITSFVAKIRRFRWHRFDKRYQIDGRRPRDGWIWWRGWRDRLICTF